LPHGAFTLQISQNHEPQLFAQLCSRNGSASAKLDMLLPPHMPASFCPLSPEAYLLTGRRKYAKNFPPLFPPKAKRGVSSEARTG